MYPARMTSDSWPQTGKLFWLGVLLGLGLSWWYASNQILTGDQTQMIHKGYLGAYQGIWMSFGNAASVVGNVPGSLSAWVVGGPLLVWDHPYAPMLLLVLLRLAGFLMLDAVVRAVFPGSGVARLSFLLLCWLNPWFLFDSLLYNPSYLIFCAGLHCWTAWHMQNSKSSGMTLLHVLSIGIAMQLHFSWPLLVFLSAFLWYRGLIRIHWAGALIAIALIVTSLFPYLLQLWADPALAHNPDPETRSRYIGWGAVHVYPVLKSAIYWLRYGSWAFPSKLVNDTGFLWLDVHFLQAMMVFAWKAIMGVLGAVTLLVALVANVMSFNRVRPILRRRAGSDLQARDWMLLYATAAFFASLLSAALAPIVFNYWHLTLIFPFALFPVLYWIVCHAYRGAHANGRPLLVAAAILLLVNLVAVNDSRKFSYAVDYAQQTLDYVRQNMGPPR